MTVTKDNKKVDIVPFIILLYIFNNIHTLELSSILPWQQLWSECGSIWIMLQFREARSHPGAALESLQTNWQIIKCQRGWVLKDWDQLSRDNGWEERRGDGVVSLITHLYGERFLNIWWIIFPFTVRPTVPENKQDSVSQTVSQIDLILFCFQFQDFHFLCPNDTVFDQQHLVCTNWFEVDCHAQLAVSQ